LDSVGDREQPWRAPVLILASSDNLELDFIKTIQIEYLRRESSRISSSQNFLFNLYNNHLEVGSVLVFQTARFGCLLDGNFSEPSIYS
jgi:hypothetical protein